MSEMLGIVVLSAWFAFDRECHWLRSRMKIVQPQVNGQGELNVSLLWPGLQLEGVN
jgi:hypothetical protein